MRRNPANKPASLRNRIAAAAARIMAEDGIDDFALAKRKAARQLGAEEGRGLPDNEEVEAELRAYRALYQAGEHPLVAIELLEVALDAMQALARFRPYLTGAVLKGIAGPYAEIEIDLYPESAKELEMFLLDRGIPFATREGRRYSGKQPRDASVFSLAWDGVPLRLSVLDPRDERMTLKKSQAGKTLDRGNVAEVEAILHKLRGKEG